MCLLCKALCQRDKLCFFFQDTSFITRTECHSIVPACLTCLWFLSPHQRCRAEEMIPMIKSLAGTYTANVSSSPEYQKQAGPLPHPPLLPLRSPGKLHVLQRSEESTTQSWMALAILSCTPLLLHPSSPRPGLAALHSFWQALNERPGGRGESCFFISEWKTKKDDNKRPKRKHRSFKPADVFSVNQRCYLTQVPYVISITLMIPKITKDFF